MQAIAPMMPWDVGPDHPSWTETLRDKTPVRIRPVRKEDAAAERAFIEALSPEARRNRFLGALRHPSDALIEKFTDLDYVHDMAFAAVVDDGTKDSFVGVSRYSTTADGKACECAVTVLDAWQDKGLGTLLMQHLIDVAKSHGIKRMWSVDSAENFAMRDLAHHLGFERSQDPDDASQVIHSLALDGAV